MADTWQLEQTLETTTGRERAWEYWSDMQNHAEMENVKIELDGPFSTGTKGRTISSNNTQEWELSEVVPKKRFVITGKDGAFSLSFAWDFYDEGTGTKMTQRIQAEGPTPVMEQWEGVFRQMEETAAQNMQRLANRLDELSR